MKHRETHANLDVPGCFACRVANVMIAGSAMPTRKAVAEMNKKEKMLDRDLDAYKRIRQTGGQPEQINGSARLEATAD